MFFITENDDGLQTIQNKLFSLLKGGVKRSNCRKTILKEKDGERNEQDREEWNKERGKEREREKE